MSHAFTVKSPGIKSPGIKSPGNRMHDPLHNPTTLTLAGLITLVAGWKGWEIVKGLMGHATKLVEGANARREIVSKETIARNAIVSAEEIAREKLLAENIAAKEARIEEGAWKLIHENRAAFEQLREDTEKQMAAMTARVDSLTAEVAEQKEKAAMAEISRTVANIRADEADTERKELKARLSIALLEVESLQRQLADRDSSDHKLRKELASMHTKLTEAERKLAMMTKTTLLSHDPNFKYPEVLASEEALADFHAHVPLSDSQE